MKDASNRRMQPLSDSVAEGEILRTMADAFPNADSAAAEIARLTAELESPRATIHVLSDVHGDYLKFRHVINNASGMLRPRVEALFAGTLDKHQLQELLSLIFYPEETIEHLSGRVGSSEAVADFSLTALNRIFAIIADLARQREVTRIDEVFPTEFRRVMRELFREATSGARSPNYARALVNALSHKGAALRMVHLAARALRDLAIDEVIVSGDLWDRGARGDLIVEFLEHQPNVWITWGNHDCAWMGAALGNEALIAHVVRVSLRYRRLAQLEEGYGISLEPLEALADECYGDDAAECFTPQVAGHRNSVSLARMQKAAAIMQFKLEGQMFERHPEWGLDERRLLHRIDHRAGTIEISGRKYPLRDLRLPTVNPHDPYSLSASEETCIGALRRAFLRSERLFHQLRFLIDHGSSYAIRDNNVIFHGCVPVDENGELLPFSLEGRELKGRALFDAITSAVKRIADLRPRPLRAALDEWDDSQRARKATEAADLLWYLWSGPRSPMFGKDRITTFERYFIADPETHEEKKNPYFRLIHEKWFCEKILREFGADPEQGLIVNGHVPVKIEQGEQPLKRSGKAITIDGAFAQAYGDHGYTLVLEPQATLLAEHHHFESVAAAVSSGFDIIPKVSVVRRFESPRKVGDCEQGDPIRARIQLLERLLEAYRTHLLPERSPASLARTLR